MLPPPAAGAPQAPAFPRRRLQPHPRAPPQPTEYYTRKYAVDKIVAAPFRDLLADVVELASEIVRNTSEVVNLLVFSKLDAFRRGDFGSGFAARRQFERSVAPLFEQNKIYEISLHLSAGADALALNITTDMGPFRREVREFVRALYHARGGSTPPRTRRPPGLPRVINHEAKKIATAMRSLMKVRPCPLIFSRRCPRRRAMAHQAAPRRAAPRLAAPRRSTPRHPSPPLPHRSPTPRPRPPTVTPSQPQAYRSPPTLPDQLVQVDEGLPQGPCRCPPAWRRGRRPADRDAHRPHDAGRLAAPLVASHGDEA